MRNFSIEKDFTQSFITVSLNANKQSDRVYEHGAKRIANVSTTPAVLRTGSAAGYFSIYIQGWFMYNIKNSYPNKFTTPDRCRDDKKTGGF